MEIAQPGGQWSKKARSKAGTESAHVWGHYDNPVPIPLTTLENHMDAYLASFPKQHWRRGRGAVRWTQYTKLPQDDKMVGMMITDKDKFNIIMDMDDAMASIELIEAELRDHCMPAIGSIGQILMMHTEKDLLGGPCFCI